jgi:hypothetical protein
MSPKTATPTPNADLDTEIALFRYGLIAQLIHDPPAPGGQEALLRAIAAKRYRIPNSTRTQVSTITLRRYLRAYRAGGFEALRPVPRGDAGVPRALAPEVLARAIALREEQPARTTQTLVDTPLACSATPACNWPTPSTSTPSPRSCAAAARPGAY